MCYETIKANYEKGLWTTVLVKMAVKKGLITPVQFKQITGFDYQV